MNKHLEKITELSIDLETYSDVDIKKCGNYKYAESPNFEILLFAVSVNNEPVTVYDLANGEELPEEILKALIDDSVTKWAFNAAFERICLSWWMKRHTPEHFKGYGSEKDSTRNYLNPVSWKCSMIWSAYMGLPLSLEGVGTVLKLENQKMKEGRKRPDPLLLRSLQTYENQWRQNQKPSGACPGKMGTVQILQQTRR